LRFWPPVRAASVRPPGLPEGGRMWDLRLLVRTAPDRGRFGRSAGSPEFELCGGHRQGEPGTAVKQSVDIGEADLGDAGDPAAVAGDAAAQTRDVPVEGGEVRTVVAVVRGALDDPQRVELLGGSKHAVLRVWMLPVKSPRSG
jgi:hypothetical protein